MDIPDLVLKVLFAAVGALASLSAAYIIVARDLAYIKGSLEHIVDRVRVADDHERRITALESLDRLAIDSQSLTN